MVNGHSAAAELISILEGYTHSENTLWPGCTCGTFPIPSAFLTRDVGSGPRGYQSTSPNLALTMMKQNSDESAQRKVLLLEPTKKL